MLKGLSLTKVRSGSGGFSTVEVLLATAIFGFLAVALAGALVYGQQSTANAGNRTRAVMLADEGLEAVRNIRDAAYTNLVDGTYGLAQAGGQWVLSGSSDTSSIYTRQVTIATVDASRKNVTASVGWNDGTVSRQSQVVTRLANWRAPTAPKTWANASLNGSLSLASTTGIKVATQGNYAYVVMASGTPNFYIIDISNTAAPVQVGSLTLASNPLNIAVSGNYAYVLTSSNTAEMQIVNISNPAAPTITGTFNAAGNADAYGIWISGTSAYMSRLSNGGSNEMQIINISNPALPTLTGGYGLAQNMRDMCVIGNYAFIATASTTQELLVVNISIAALPFTAGSLDLPGAVAPTSLYCYNNTVYVGHGSVLRAVNVTSPTAPTLAGSLTTTGPGTINDISADQTNNILFLGTSYTAGELQIINVTTSSAMTILKTVDIPGTTSALNGVAFNAMLDIAVGTDSSATQGFVTFVKN